MKRFVINSLLATLIFSVQSFTVPNVAVQASSSSYSWSQVSNYGETEWVLYYGGHQVYGWNYVNGNWYYLYEHNGYMAHDTFINGYYVNSHGAWTNDIPYAVQRILDVVPNPGWIYSCGNYGEFIAIFKNENLKELCSNGWNAPNIDGTLVVIGEGGEHFVADDGTVYKVPHQAYETIYQYDSQGNVVNQYPYIGDKCYG